MGRCTLKRKLISLILTVTISLSLGSTAFAASESQTPKLVAKTAVSIDADTGELIYGNKADTKVYPASTTKLLTALMLVDAKKSTDVLTYTKSAQEQPSASINKDVKPLKPGEKITVDNALKGLLIYSANDIAYMIAGNLTGKLDASVKDTNTAFSPLMNKKIAALGLKNTHFITANGLFDKDHYSTAYDMSVIAKAAFSNKLILDAVKQEKATVQTESGLSIPITNRNKLILPSETSLYDKTCIGGKTGYLNNAGKCLIAVFNRNNRKIIGVVMDSSYDAQDTQVFKDMENLINYSYTINYTKLYSSGSTVKTEAVTYKPLKFFGPSKTVSVPLVLKEDVNYYKNDINDKEKKLTVNTPSLNVWKLNTDTAVGTVTLTERGINKTYKLYPALSSGSIIGSNKLTYAAAFIGTVLCIGLVLALIGKISSLTRRKNRRKSRYR